MKKKAKYILVGALVLTIMSGATINALQPLNVDVVLVEPTHAQAYFTERGYVREYECVDVYSLVGGKILSINVREGQAISVGEVIAEVDPSDFIYEIERIKINNKAILAQIDNIKSEESRTKDSQEADKNALQGELNSINAQAQMAQISRTDQQQVKEENIRLQNVLIEQSRRDLQNAELEAERANMLYEVEAISKAELEITKQTLEDCKTALTANEQKLAIISSETSVDQSAYYAALRYSVQAKIGSINSALDVSYSEPMKQYYQAQIEAGDLEIAKLERMIENSTITSHVSGTIERLNIESTNVLNTSVPVAEIRTEKENLVEVFVSTVNIRDIQIGDKVELIITRQSGDVVYTGTLQDISNKAEVMVSALGIEERRVKVTIKPDALSEDFKIGFDVDVRFITYSTDNRMIVPKTAIFEEDGQSRLYTVKNGTVISTSIEPGIQLKTGIVVESGISSGDVVVSNASQDGLRDGVKVKY